MDNFRLEINYNDGYNNIIPLLCKGFVQNEESDADICSCQDFEIDLDSIEVIVHNDNERVKRLIDITHIIDKDHFDMIEAVCLEELKKEKSINMVNR